MNLTKDDIIEELPKTNDTLNYDEQELVELFNSMRKTLATKVADELQECIYFSTDGQSFINKYDMLVVSLNTLIETLRAKEEKKDE